MGEKLNINIAAPDIVSVCIDDKKEGLSRGRMYCCFSQEAYPFENEHQLLRLLDRLMENINYPQSSVELRSYSGTSGKRGKIPGKPWDSAFLLQQRGKLATLIVHVKYRQNATWQGEVIWVERSEKQIFLSELEFLKLMDCVQLSKRAIV